MRQTETWPIPRHGDLSRLQPEKRVQLQNTYQVKIQGTEAAQNLNQAINEPRVHKRQQNQFVGHVSKVVMPYITLTQSPVYPFLSVITKGGKNRIKKGHDSGKSNVTSIFKILDLSPIKKPGIWINNWLTLYLTCQQSRSNLSAEGKVTQLIKLLLLQQTYNKNCYCCSSSSPYSSYRTTHYHYYFWYNYFRAIVLFAFVYMYITFMLNSKVLPIFH